MSIKVTIHNYIFPIHFSYKGWRVELEKKIDLFKDVKVEATFTPPHIDFDYWNIIVPAPMKPMPVTTCDAMREGSNDVCRSPSILSWNPYCEITINSALPRATRKCVRNPASLAR